MKHGQNLPMWLRSFKIAIAESNVEKITELIENVPEFDKVIDMTEALYLIKEADKLIQELQEENRQIKSKLAKHIEFIKSTRNKGQSNLDISH